MVVPFLIEERKVRDSYEVAYLCKPNLIKVVRYGPMGKGREVPDVLKGTFWGELQIQHTGLERKLERIELWDGNRIVVSGHYPLGNTTERDRKEGLKDSVKIAKEFKEIFSINPRLSKRIDYFRALRKYLQ